MLSFLYDCPVSIPDWPMTTKSGLAAASELSETKSSVQSALRDATVRRAVELHAEDSAVEHFRGLGWEVNRVGALKLGYDLDCTNPAGEALHVEVKGTQTRGEEVILTQNEKLHNQLQEQCSAEHALYVLSQIKVMQNNEPPAQVELQHAYGLGPFIQHR